MSSFTKAQQWLIDADPILGAIIKEHGRLKPIKRHPAGAFGKLSSAIIGQQLSVKAAATIWQRLQDCVSPWTADNVARADHDALRACGCSARKADYLQLLATSVCDGSCDLESLRTLSNEEAISELCRIKGIGTWTAEMFLMFELKRPDIFSVGDAGLQRAIQNLYQPKDTSPDGYRAIAERWQPYRTTACRYLWKSLDNEPKTSAE